MQTPASQLPQPKELLSFLDFIRQLRPTLDEVASPQSLAPDLDLLEDVGQNLYYLEERAVTQAVIGNIKDVFYAIRHKNMQKFDFAPKPNSGSNVQSFRKWFYSRQETQDAIQMCVEGERLTIWLGILSSYTDYLE